MLVHIQFIKQVSLGCYNDNINNQEGTNLRDLKFQINSTSLDRNSIETCQTLCAQAGYKISAVQFG